jgi:hypothetical protein
MYRAYVWSLPTSKLGQASSCESLAEHVFWLPEFQPPLAAPRLIVRERLHP